MNNARFELLKEEFDTHNYGSFASAMRSEIQREIYSSVALAVGTRVDTFDALRADGKVYSTSPTKLNEHKPNRPLNMVLAPAFALDYELTNDRVTRVVDGLRVGLDRLFRTQLTIVNEPVLLSSDSVIAHLQNPNYSQVFAPASFIDHVPSNLGATAHNLDDEWNRVFDEHEVLAVKGSPIVEIYMNDVILGDISAPGYESKPAVMIKDDHVQLRFHIELSMCVFSDDYLFVHLN